MTTIGVITNYAQGVFQSLVIAGVRSVAESRGYGVIIDSLTSADGTAHDVSLDLDAVQGILIIANAAPLELLKAAYDMGKPISLVSHHIPELPIPEVVFNNVQGIQALLRHLIADCGRQQVVFVRGVPGQYDGHLRENTFRRELMRYNLDIPETYFLDGDFDPVTAAKSIRYFLEMGLPFDAVLASDYRMAAAVMAELRSAGIAVPEQVAVVGFGDAPEAESAGITTVAANVQELGARSARQLLSQINGLKIRGVTTLSVELVIRQSSMLP